MNDQAFCLFYSRLLFQLISETKYEEIISELQEIWKILEKYPQFIKILDSLIPNHEKKNILQRVFSGKINAKMILWLEKIAKKNKIFLLPKIIQKLSDQLKLQQGIFPLTLIVPQPLEAESRLRLQEKLAARYQKQIELKEMVDPKLIGGIVLIFDDKRLDYSLKAKLKRLQESLLKGK